MSLRRQSVAGSNNEVFCELYSLQKLQSDKDFSLQQPHSYLVGRSKKKKMALDGKNLKFKKDVLNYKSKVFKNIFDKYDIPYSDIKQYMIYDDFPNFTIVFLEINNEKFYAFFDCLNPIQSKRFCDLLRNKLKFEMLQNSLNFVPKEATTRRNSTTPSEATSEAKQPSLEGQQLKSILKTNTVVVEPEKRSEVKIAEERNASLIVEKNPETIVIVKSLAENDASRIRPESKIYNTPERTQFDRDRIPLYVEEFDDSGLKRVLYYSSKFMKEPQGKPEKIPQMREEPQRFYDNYNQNYTISRRGYSGNSFEFDDPDEILLPTMHSVQPLHRPQPHHHHHHQQQQQIIMSPRIQRSLPRETYVGSNDYMPLRNEPLNYNLSRSSSMKRNESLRQSNRKSSTASSFSEFLNLDRVKNPYITHRNNI